MSREPATNSEPNPGRPRRARPLDVAIVGMACRFPGARDLFAFWDNVLAGRDSTRDVPSSRWDAGVFFDPDSSANDRVSCRRGGYLDEPIDVDPARFGVMPLAVEGGEPEQFLVLDAAHAALADAGLAGGVAPGARVEVVIGRGNYFNRGNLTRLQHGRIVAQTLGILRALHPEWTDADLDAVRADLKAGLPPFEAGTVAGQLTNATAGRVADRLDFTGASYVVDAASASSLVALDLGARALVDGRADLAVVGGVYLQPDVDFPLVFSRLGALSRRGEARPFAGSADGTVPGEGVGVVVLKRLADAERDGDRAYAVVKGVGLASDGRGAGLAAPSARGHARAIRRAYRVAGVAPETVDLVEGHGLGVPASDLAELRALRAVFPRPERGRRSLGAVSALIGHAMPAAGMAGLIKTALALHHRVIPPAAHAGDPHPLLAHDDSPFALNPAARPWVHGDPARPRRAGVNAFGFAGVSAHAVLEEHAASADGDTPGCMPRWETEAILLGADDRPRWVELARALLAWLDSGRNDRVPLKDLAYTLNTGQSRFGFRVGLVTGSVDDLRTRLRALADRLADPGCRSVRDAKGTYFWGEPLGGPGRLAFLYPGEGSQYPGMLADLCPHFPELRAGLDTSDRIARERGHDRLPSEQLFGAGGDGLWAVGTAVNIVLSSQWALHQLLKRLGLRPDAVVGHSSGEFLALAAAGVIRVDRNFEDQLGDIATVFEGQEKAGLVPSARLVAVAADRARVEAACREAGVWGGVGIAIDNCPHQVVIAGPDEGVGAAVAALRGQGVLCEDLPFRRAYHTPGFAGAVGPLRSFFSGLKMKRPAVPVYSCASAAKAGDDVETVRRLAVDQWASPVAFRSTVEAMHADGVRLFVEVGARGSLTGFVEDTLRGRPHFAVSANLPRRSGVTQLNHLVASLYAQGVGLDPGHLYARRRPRRVDLSADFPCPQPGPSLAVGFPEMTLSKGLAERLRGVGRGSADGVDGGAAPPALRPAAADRLGVSLDITRNGHTHANGKPSVNGHAATPAPPADAGAKLVAYFRTMDAFLETQREVMDAYLASSRRTQSVEATRPPAAPPTPAEVVAAPAPVVEAGTTDVRELLLGQVSRRTGYPREMLALDDDMEADLGIDSIKRVEILGELQASGVVPDGDGMERLSRCRTLGQVLDALRPAGPEPAGPSGWAGEVERFVAGREFVGVRWLDAAADPVARHHTLGGRRLSAVEPDRLGYPVVPFTVMAELLAQAAATLAPGKAVVGLRDVQANRWIPYEDEPVALELHALRDPSRPAEVCVTIKNRGPRGANRPGADESAVGGTVVFADARAPGPLAGDFALPEAGACRFSARELYEDQWLFHGPALQALTRVGAASRHGIEGTITVLPRRALLPESLWPVLHTDPIVLDAFTHLLGGWGLDKQAGEEGDVMFPLRVARLDLFGADPPEGAEVACRVRVTDLNRHRVRVDAEIVAPDGRVWVALSGWEDWRFYWPGRYRDVFRQPAGVLVGEPLDLPGGGPGAGLAAVWLEPPADMGKPVWRDVLACVQLGPDERAADRARVEDGPGLSLSGRVRGRTAAKEAARRLWLARGGEPVYPADLALEGDPDGSPRLRSLAEPGRTDLPAVAVAHAEGVAVALASLDPSARLGVAVARLGAGEDEREARLRCAREAVLMAAGEGADVVGVDPSDGGAVVRAGGVSYRCVTARRGDHVWAWTNLERAKA